MTENLSTQFTEIADTPALGATTFLQRKIK